MKYTVIEQQTEVPYRANRTCRTYRAGVQVCNFINDACRPAGIIRYSNTTVYYGIHEHIASVFQ